MFRFTISCFFILLPQFGFAASPWLPEPGAASISVTTVDESFDEFYRADADAQLVDDIKQTSFAVSVEYGLYDSLAIDARVGYTETSFSPATRGDFSGTDDSVIGVRWRFRDEYVTGSGPSMALRAAAIFAGDYEESSIGNPHSPGDSASGIGLSLIVGKSFASGLSLVGEVGYKDRESPVPSEAIYNIGAYYWLTPKFMLSTSYLREEALSGADMGDPGINPTRFDELKEIKNIVDFGVAYQITESSNLAVNVARTVSGRNTGKKEVAIVTLGLAF